MNEKQFKNACSEICDFIVLHKNRNIDDKINMDSQPGDLCSVLQKFKFNENSKNFTQIFEHFIDVIYPYSLNWQHPLFMGYFPSCNSYPSILGELLSAGLGTIGFAWKSCPALTELEMFSIHEIIRLMHLPFASGNILSSSSEAIMISMITAIHRAKIDRNKLVVYTSDLAHSCIYKAASILQLKISNIAADKSNWGMNTFALKQKIEQDLKKDLIPLYICATFGTTSLASIDNINIIGKISRKYNIYLHIDAAYGGNALFIRKYRKMLKGIDYADSININCNKLMLVNYDCTLVFYKDTAPVVDALSFDPPYLNSDYNRIDLRNYDISLSRRFRSLKLWFTLHTYGIKGIRRHMKRLFRRARILAAMIIKNDTRLEVVNKVKFGLVCFRIKNSNSLTNILYQKLSKYQNMYYTSSSIYGFSFIRISINNIKSRNELNYIASKITKSIDSIMGPQDSSHPAQTHYTCNTLYEEQLVCLDRRQEINKHANKPIYEKLKSNDYNDQFEDMLNKAIHNRASEIVKPRRRSISNIIKDKNVFIQKFIQGINTDSR